MGIILTILMYVGIVLVSIAGAYIVFMLIMALGPRKPVPEQPLVKAKKPIQREDFIRIELKLEAYAIRYQEAGFAVFAFDFRYLGESGGEPRQLVWIPYQLEDYAAAVKYVRNLKEIDSEKIALWGSSLSGGHVIMTAAKDHKIACVSAQVPLLDGDAGGMQVVKQIGLWHLLKMAFGHGLRDLVRSWLGLSPHAIPLFGKPGSIAALADAGAWDFFKKHLRIT